MQKLGVGSPTLVFNTILLSNKLCQDVILVLGRVHGATERVTGFPEDDVDFVLGDGEED